ncbi:MAG: hypothetical protein WAV32_09500 [Halobacteriota archaeon]
MKYFTVVHLESTSQIKEEIEQNGGYVLQIDGTQNHGRGTIMLLKDFISCVHWATACSSITTINSGIIWIKQGLKGN